MTEVAENTSGETPVAVKTVSKQEMEIIMDSECSIEMPKYVCNKEVWALKIKMVGVAEGGGSGLITPEDSRYAAFEVSKEYLEKHRPQPGGYYVLYKDGYASFSPAEAFEDGYKLKENK